MAFRHEIHVRSRDVDMQRVVASANYLAYVGECVDTWARTAVGPEFEQDGWDGMLKRAVLEWHAAARLGDLLTLDACVARWGTSSFDVDVLGRVGERPVFTALATYVSVRPDTFEPIATPPAVRAAFGEAIAPAPSTLIATDGDGAASTLASIGASRAPRNVR